MRRGEVNMKSGNMSAVKHSVRKQSDEIASSQLVILKQISERRNGTREYSWSMFCRLP